MRGPLAPLTQSCDTLAARARGKHARQAPTLPLTTVSQSSQGCCATAAAASRQVARRGSDAAVLSSGSSAPAQALRTVAGRPPPAKAQDGAQRTARGREARKGGGERCRGRGRGGLRSHCGAQVRQLRAGVRHGSRHGVHLELEPSDSPQDRVQRSIAATAVD